MFDNHSHAGTWSDLVGRLDRSHAIARWSVDEPALRGLTDVAHVVRLTAKGCDGARADDVLGALVRRAAGPRRDDDALLLVLHLLNDMAVALALDLRDLSYDVLPIIINELACQVRSIDLDRVGRCWAATLKWATRRAVLAEFRPGVRRHHPEARELPVDVDSPCWLRPRVGAAPTDVDDDDLDVVDLLCWAASHGVPRDDIRLLVATETARATGQPGAGKAIAKQNGIGVATLYRRNDHTLSVLRRCRMHYLAAVA